MTLGRGAGVHPLTEWFRSVVILLAVDADGRITGPDITALARWLAGWDRWWRRTTGIDEGRRLHLVYRREVAVITPVPVRQLETMRPLAETCRALGLAWSVTVTARDAAGDVEAFRTALVDGRVHGVTLCFDDDEPVPEGARRLVALALASGTRVTLAGASGPIVASGLLAADGINGCHVTLEPTVPLPLRDTADGTRPDPCARRFRIVIDPAGDVYPCYGLLGLPHGRLGSVTRRFSPAPFTAPGAGLDLARLAAVGPPVTAAPPVSGGSLPPICDLHRAQLEATHSRGPTADLRAHH